MLNKTLNIAPDHVWKIPGMTFLSVRIRAILCTALLGLGVAPSNVLAADSFVPAATLVADQTQILPITPDALSVSGASAYVIGKAEGRSQIIKLDVATLEILAGRPLDFDAKALIASYDGKNVYVIGERSGETYLVVLGSELDQLGELILSRPLAFPTMSWSDGYLLVVSGMRTETAQGTFLVIDAAEDSQMVPVPAFRSDFAQRGITGAWLWETADGTPTAFMNAGFGAGLIAIGLGPKGDMEFGDISFGHSKGGDEPFTTSALMPSRLCRGEGAQPAFLISDSTRGVLLLASFDPDFKSLDVHTDTQTSLALTAGADPVRFPGSDIRLPTSLLASSCDQGVIWVGNLYSNEFEQFAVNPNILAIEKVGTVKLPVHPNGVAISGVGDFALVISAENNAIMRFQNGDGGVIGNEEARTLQRLLAERGYSVGSIDGIIGSKTLSAVSRFEDRNGVQLNIGRDLQGALEAIQSTTPRQ